ncbi:hypothetical protein [Agrococcus jenensis]|uniref:Uncharacterized protein n=1 Tax=Agrococcus jenensis TaxID=46353 RepID=A0A3N2ARX3_9MICO|nr:hypothetical protein [Agrococcus jenensis]ROR65799.1 hypothetical protein EDD26_1169 [Agrococcus jenensis]
MSTTHATEATTPTEEQTSTSATAKPGRTTRRWPWIVALVVVALLGALGAGIAASSAANAQAELTSVRAELAAVQADYADLETRAGIAQSSLDLIREHRDRLELQLEEMQASQG